MAPLLRCGWILAFACALLIYPAVWLAARSSTEAYFIVPFDAKQVELNRFLDTLDPKDPEFDRKVMRIYGVPNEQPDRVVFVPKERFLHPPEKPSLTLLPVDKEKGENPMQVKTLYFFAKWTVRGAGGVGVVLFLLWCLALRFRQPKITNHE